MNFDLDGRRGFGSDNHSGAHPEILDAIQKANLGHTPSYGTDPITEAACEVFRKHFGAQAETHFVFNGTAANVLALSSIAKTFQTVLCAQQAHINQDECGAPEKNLGCRVVGIPTADGKLTPDLIRPFLIRRGDQHYSQVSAISITQPTELGTIYTLEELQALSTFARSERLAFHVDGARLVNASVALGVSLKEMIADCGVDVVSVGGTKNGLLFGEAVVFLKPGLSQDFKYVRKQLMQLPSKTRFIAAQFIAFLGTDLWRRNAEHALAMAQYLEERLRASKGAEVTQKTQANAVFARLPKALIKPLRAEAFFYVWNEATFECRLMTTWDTQKTEIDHFVATLDQLASA